MPRQARIGFPDLVHHVISRGNNRNWVFKDESDFRRYLDILKRYKDRYGFRLYHWVLMNNHVHLLLEPSAMGRLGKIMQGVNLSYTLWFHRKYRQVGHLWQDRFKSFPVERDAYLLECGRYIERNPLRVGLVGAPEEYPWSSYARHRSGREDGLTDRHPLLEEMFAKGGGDAYSTYVCGPRDREEEELRERMKGGVVGSKAFLTILETDWRNACRPGRGRPRKK